MAKKEPSKVLKYEDMLGEGEKWYMGSMRGRRRDEEYIIYFVLRGKVPAGVDKNVMKGFTDLWKKYVKIKTVPKSVVELTKDETATPVIWCTDVPDGGKFPRAFYSQDEPIVDNEDVLQCIRTYLFVDELVEVTDVNDAIKRMKLLSGV